MTVIVPTSAVAHLARWSSRAPWRLMIFVAVVSVLNAMCFIPMLQGPAAAEALVSLGVVALLAAGMSYVAGWSKADSYALTGAVALGAIGSSVNLEATVQIVSASLVAWPALLIARWLTDSLTHNVTVSSAPPLLVARVAFGNPVCDTAGTGSCPDYGPGLDLVDDEHRCALEAPHRDDPHECLCGKTWTSC